MRSFRSLVLLLVLVGVGWLCRVPAASAEGPAVWTNLGLYGGQIYDIAIDPVTPDKMFAGSYLKGGLFVTTDGGTTWRVVEASNDPPDEATFKNHAVWAVKIAPSDHNVIWVAHDYWVEKSTDGGQTWTHIWNATMQRDCQNCGGESDNFRFCRSIAIHPTDPNTVYVGTGGPDGQGANGAMYKTTDGGVTWTKLKGGGNFDYSIISIAFDTSNAQVMWAITDSHGDKSRRYGYGSLYRSGDGGDVWTLKISVETAWYDLALKPDEPNVVFLATWFGILRVIFDSSGNFVSYTAPLGWQGGSNVRSLSFDPQDPGTLYAAWQGTKLSRSSDGGVSFADTFEVGYQFLVLAVHPTDRERLFAGEVGRGMYTSGNHGQNWTAINEGINAGIFYDVAVDPTDKTHILAATIAGLYEKRDISGWSLISNFPSTYAFTVIFDLAAKNTYYAGTGTTLAKTIDGGVSWTYSNYLGSNVVDIAVDPIDGNTIYVIVGGGLGGNGGVCKSTDGGATFTQVLSATALKDQGLIGEEYPFNVIAIDPSDHQHLFAGGGYAPEAPGDLWESRDGGVNWARTGLQNVPVYALLIDARNAQVMYAGCGNGVYKSTDGGVSWIASLESYGVTDLEFHRTDANIVYASTLRAGVFVSPNQGGNWLNLGEPEYHVFAIATSSLYGATEGGVYQCTGTGVIAGSVTDASSGAVVEGATIVTDFGMGTVSVNGSYMMVSPSGTFSVTVTAPGYTSVRYVGTVVYGGDVTWVNVAMAQLEPPVPPAPTLESVSLSGPESVQENSHASYTAIATFSDGSTRNVTAQASWSEDSPSASISGGRLTATEVSGNQTVTVTASYTTGGVTKSGSKTVTVVDVTPAVGDAPGHTSFNSRADEQVRLDLNITNSRGDAFSDIKAEWLVLTATVGGVQLPIYVLTSGWQIFDVGAVTDFNAVTYNYDHSSGVAAIVTLAMGSLGLSPGDTLMYGYAYTTSDVSKVVLDNIVTLSVK